MNLDDPALVRYHLQEMSVAGSQAHEAASEEGGLNGVVRDLLFGINSTIDAVRALVEDQ